MWFGAGRYGGQDFTLLMCSWPELWLRWVQFGVFSPVFRTHCEAFCSCQPWDYMVDPVYTSAITSAFQLREALMPYVMLYTRHRNRQFAKTISRLLYSICSCCCFLDEMTDIILPSHPPPPTRGPYRYIYTAAHEAYRTGIAINHPLYYDAPVGTRCFAPLVY